MMVGDRCYCEAQNNQSYSLIGILGSLITVNGTETYGNIDYCTRSCSGDSDYGYTGSLMHRRVTH